VSAPPADVERDAVVRVAGSGYFDVMRIPVVAGRTFDRRDNSSAPIRVVLSESLAGRLFGFAPPIGRQIWLARIARPAEIIGIVGDVSHRALDDGPSPTVYLSAWQSASRSNHLVVRSARPHADVIATVREEVARLDRQLPVYDTRSMADVLAASPGVPARRVLTATFLGFAVLAVVLGGIGLFGVVAHDVASRRRELGIRIALGADPRHILSATVGQAVVMVGFGLMLGGVLSIWAVGALNGVLFATDRLDLLSVGAAAAVLLVAGAVAVLPAALRGARTDPLLALRSE
jgi:putative ABC transport system permease protein